MLRELCLPPVGTEREGLYIRNAHTRPYGRLEREKQNKNKNRTEQHREVGGGRSAS